MGNVSLKVLEKYLNYLLKKGFQPWITLTRLICRVASTLNVDFSQLGRANFTLFDLKAA